jgi:predicted nuclease of predicted toxin-antitoxin system
VIAFKLDENMPTFAVRELRARGFDAVSVLDQSLHGVSDTSLAQVCKSEQRCLMTMDWTLQTCECLIPVSTMESS